MDTQRPSQLFKSLCSDCHTIEPNPYPYYGFISHLLEQDNKINLANIYTTPAKYISGVTWGSQTLYQYLQHPQESSKYKTKCPQISLQFNVIN